MFKKIVTISIIVVILIGAGFAAFLYFTSQSGEFEGREIEERGFFPFQGRGGTGEGGEEGGFEFATSTNKAPIFRKVSEKPVSGGVVFERDEKTFIRYNERETGHIFETPAALLKTERISNTTIPKITNVSWSSTGNSFLARFLGENDETIKTFLTRISKKEKSGEEEVKDNEEDKENKVRAEDYLIETEFLNQDIKFISQNSEGSYIFGLKEKKSGSMAYIKDLKTGDTSTLYSSSIAGWNTLWPKGSNAYLLSAPSYIAEGVLISIDTNTGNYKKELSGFTGLTANPSPSGEYILFSQSKNNTFKTYIKNTKNNTIKGTAVNTLPEKCVWSKVKNHIIYCPLPRNIETHKYPDDWYKGKVFFQDDIWKINAKKNIVEKVYTISESKYGKIDAIKTKISPKDKYLIFVNKRSSSLWSLRIGE